MRGLQGIFFEGICIGSILGDANAYADTEDELLDRPKVHRPLLLWKYLGGRRYEGMIPSMFWVLLDDWRDDLGGFWHKLKGESHYNFANFLMLIQQRNLWQLKEKRNGAKPKIG